jgi:hypothetical protein
MPSPGGQRGAEGLAGRHVPQLHAATSGAGKTLRSTPARRLTFPSHSRPGRQVADREQRAVGREARRAHLLALDEVVTRDLAGGQPGDPLVAYEQPAVGAYGEAGAGKPRQAGGPAAGRRVPRLVVQISEDLGAGGVQGAPAGSEGGLQHR